MAERLKDSFGRDIPARIADAIAAVDPGFDSAAFLADALEGYDELELTPRARHIAEALHRHLPADYDRAIGILLATLGPPIDPERTAGDGAVPVRPAHLLYRRPRARPLGHLDARSI